MHITLTGNLGSGKSTLGKLLVSEYGFEIFSTGKVIRQIAQEHGVSVLEMNKRMESDHQYDHMIDDTTARISREHPEKQILFDSRLAWNFVEESFKVFLSVSLQTAAERVFADASRGEVESYASVEECRASLKDRAVTEDRRYRELYGIDYFNYANYNLVLDSTNCPPELLTKILMEEAAVYEKLKEEGKSYGTKLIVEPDRPEEDFAVFRAKGTVSKEIFHEKEFLVIRLS